MDYKLYPILPKLTKDDVLDDKLYKLLSSGNIKIARFIEKHGKYNVLIKLIEKIEVKHEKPDELNVWEKLLLSRHITELPTTELLEILNKLVKFFKISYVYELYSRSGLLSYLLGTIHGVPTRACDDKEIIPYVPIKKISNNNIRSVINHTKKSMIIVNWAPANKYDHIIKLLMSKVIPVVVFIGEYYEDESYIIYSMNRLGYSKNILFGKQICWKDYYHNRMVLNEYTQSKIIVFTKNSIHGNIDNKTLINQCGQDNFVVQLQSQDYLLKMMMEELAIRNKLPLWISRMKDPILFNKVCIICSKVLGKDKLIPYWISNYDSLVFWCLSIIHNIMPKYCYKSKDSFNLYMYNIVNLQNKGLMYYKEKNLIPKHINNIKEAENYFYLYFSKKKKDAILYE